MGKNIGDMAEKLVKAETLKFAGVNPNLLEVVKSRGKKPGYAKIAMDDQVLNGMMGNNLVGFMLLVDRDEYERIYRDLVGEETEE